MRYCHLQVVVCASVGQALKNCCLLLANTVCCQSPNLSFYMTNIKLVYSRSFYLLHGHLFKKEPFWLLIMLLYFLSLLNFAELEDRGFFEFC